ncbi:Transcriptional regulator, TetR family [Cystobacter fuscus DSM 2262]|uniref:Transcriptional regulator, TetR family n=1 Tax=Cystobacter fuscus (strain ATCC 25194 / DSM 2262 / NBRC 100088 / M29) TaxID=1242864 RepID=S9P1T1_CYSF2|nr:TetR/AcrR family transcriptional regulator [Cystobacter fuscus]EPX56222.1 Transcriptional regulator, TetR family [Cystobacter fuscus DSM 2262]
MSGRNRASPRKRPRQERAKATVEVILEAAAHVLVSSGYEGTTTKQVAERAGVSIGSLYQYFPSKEALVAMLVERLHQRVLGILADKLVPRPITDLEREVRELVRSLVDVYGVNPELQRVLLEQAPRIGPLQVVQEIEARVEFLVQGVLSQNLEFERPRNLGMVVFIIIRALRSAVWAAVVERPELIGTPELVEELSALVLGYLRPRAPGPARPEP